MVRSSKTIPQEKSLRKLFKKCKSKNSIAQSEVVLTPWTCHVDLMPSFLAVRIKEETMRDSIEPTKEKWLMSKKTTLSLKVVLTTFLNSRKMKSLILCKSSLLTSRSLKKKSRKLLTSWTFSEPILIPRTSSMSSSLKINSLCLEEIRETWWHIPKSRMKFLN